MTREEAKTWLNKLYARADITDEYGDMEDMQPYAEAVNMAIEALEQEPCDDVISRQAVMDCFKKWQPYMATRLWNFEQELSALPSVKPQESCEDEYIKVPKKALKYVTKGIVAYNYEWLKNHFDIERAVICGVQEPSGDAISKQAVIDSLHNKFADGFDSDRWWNSMSVLYAINKVPPVNPQEKTGHWIDTGSGQECSECGEVQYGYDNYRYFCSYCGADMRGGE